MSGDFLRNFQSILDRNTMNLNEISIFRPFLILCILIGHCFAVYSGVWEKPDDIAYIEAYKFINPIFISFQLAGFTFISGYLAAYKKQSIFKKGFLLKKLQRLILPSIIFSTIYYFLFKYQGNHTIGVLESTVYILNGSGHLWFLPMLFWCFVFLWIIVKMNFNSWIVLSLFLISFISPIPLYRIPLGIGKAIYYFPFFYFGFLIWQLRCRQYRQNFLIIATFCLYCFSLVFKLHCFSKFIGETTLFLTTLKNTVDLICLLSGTYTTYLVIMKLFHNVDKLPRCVMLANKYSYAVYVIHQFILLWLVYDVNYTQKLNEYLVPFFWLAATLFLSCLLSIVFLKTKFGKFLLG